jgi:CRP/FNR family transcriptional regulator, dissimilatory nitrate respiration regulator
MDLFTFDSLPPALRQAIAIRTLASEQILFRQGDSASAMFIVKSGRLKIVRHTPEGRLVTLQVVRPGDSFGEGALFSEFYAYTAIAEVPSQVVVYPKLLLLAALRERQNLAEDFMTLLVKRNLSLIIRLELRDIQAAHRRVLQYLHYLTQANGSTVITFDRPLKAIATDLGLTPATLSRALARLEREGMISRNQKIIKLNTLSVA